MMNEEDWRRYFGALAVEVVEEGVVPGRFVAPWGVAFWHPVPATVGLGCGCCRPDGRPLLRTGMVPRSAKNFLEQVAEKGETNVRNFGDASPEVQRLIDPFFQEAPRLRVLLCCRMMK